MTNKSNEKNKYRWLIFGPIWGILMVLIMGVFEPMYYDTPITVDTLQHDLLRWLPVGIILGVVSHLISNRTKKED